MAARPVVVRVQRSDDVAVAARPLTAGEQLTTNERHGYREIAIWKERVTL